MLKWWPTLLLATAAFFYFDFYSLKKPKEMMMLNEGCLVHSLYFQQALQANEMLEPYMWSRVLAIHFLGKLGHAVTIFIYKNITWVYDPNRGSFPIATYPIYDPNEVAEIAFPKLIILKAYFIEPTFLLQYKNNTFTLDR